MAVKSLVVTGSIGIDTVYTPQGSAEDVLGGSAVYFAFGASRLTQVRLVGAAGDDLSERYVRLLQDAGIDIEGLEIRQGSRTFRWTGRYLDNMNVRETLLLELNVLAERPPSIPDSYRESEYVFLANNDPDVQLEFIGKLSSPEFIVADTMDHWIRDKRESLLKLLSRVDGIILNDSEAKMFSGTGNLIKAAKRITDAGPSFVVIKKGEHGAILVEDDKIVAVPSYPVEDVIDPTGAGDSFAGGFMGYLAARGSTTFEDKAIALTYGTVIASFVIEDFSVNAIKDVDVSRIEERRERLLKIMGFGIIE